jgi:L-fuculose-phosphate aldolase
LWSEILDAYCRILMLAKQLGHVHYLGHDKARELLELKQKWGWSDPRLTKEYEGCDVCGNAIFRDTWEEADVKQRAFAPPQPEHGDMNSSSSSKSSIAGVDLEQLVATITKQVIEALKT